MQTYPWIYTPTCHKGAKLPAGAAAVHACFNTTVQYNGSIQRNAPITAICMPLGKPALNAFKLGFAMMRRDAGDVDGWTWMNEMDFYIASACAGASSCCVKEVLPEDEHVSVTALQSKLLLVQLLNACKAVTPCRWSHHAGGHTMQVVTHDHIQDGNIVRDGALMISQIARIL
eukprot:283310-Chlamydomonas_euryale.AAC.8